jgi:ribosomal protein S18 acetylase RimI-like enzyme
MDVHIREMTSSDVDAVAGLQLATLGDSLVTQLGRRFLNAFHACALRDGATIGLIAETARGDMAGFALATTDGAGFRARIRASVWPALLRALSTRPTLLVKFASSLVQREPASTMRAELLLLAVGAEYRRHRTATDLLAVLEDRLRATGAAGYRVAVRSWLEGALNFYCKSGFEREAEAVVLGAPMSYLRRRLSGPLS